MSRFLTRRLTRHLAIILTAMAFVSVARAQPIYLTPPEDNFAAPIVWTQYKIPTQNLSVAFPKLPVVHGVSDLCSQTEGQRYTAYAEQAVYEFTWHARIDKPFPKECKSPVRFSQKQYLAKVDEFRKFNSAVESESKVFGSPAIMFRSEFDASITTHWIVWDIDRWFEISVVRRKDLTAGEERFLASISIPESNAAEIGAGSPRILGDKPFDTPKIADGQKPSKPEGLVIASKPRPGYTDIARSNNTQGTVVLKVTFLRNGGIGAIFVIKALENGLTDQAIAAASRIAFLPFVKDGIPETAIKQVEYSFSIY